MDEYTGLRKALEHVSAIPITPFHPETGEILWEALHQNVGYLLRSGVKVVVSCGNTGEYFSLTMEEAVAVTRRVIQEVQSSAITVAGVGYSVDTAIELGKRAAEDGADAVLIHQPIHPYITSQGAYEYYETIIEALPVPSIIYFKDPNLSDEILLELSNLPKFVAVKYAINDLPRFAKTAHHLMEKDVTLICGTAERWAPFFFMAGATGFTSGLVNVSPQRSLAMLRALQSHDEREVWRIWHEVLPFEELRAKEQSGYNVAVIKEALNQLNFPAGRTRQPVGTLPAEDKQAVAQVLRAWNMAPFAGSTQGPRMGDSNA
ncbi:dihydrodipicolinate synthase family protein [Alicyclobacillus curvatus]|jgi:4-hydroxy-tetrahydrodipicolinate synthase|nr:dihydrodipicolinate synthase family protein [Alicyclobacillus curvatus]